MLGHQARDAPLGRLGQRIVGRAHVGELGLAADRRDRAGMQHRAIGRQALERGIGVPQPVAEIVEPLAVVGVEDAVLGVEIADIGHVLVQAQLVVLARLEDGGLERPEIAREGELALVVELLVGKDQHGVLGEGGADGGEIVGRERPAERDIAHFGGEIRRDRLDGDGHGFLLGFLRSCVWP